ncbi:MAG: N-acetyltransferase [Thermoleophilia bacterium]|nr:N-acetyltransferase [Thermoleophilia bacterium]
MTPPGVHVHPSALAETDRIGEGTRIWAFAHVLPGAVVGRDCNIGDHCYVESGAVIGDGVTIKNGVMVWDGVTLEDGVFVGPGAIFTNDLRPRSPRGGDAGDRYAGDAWLTPTVVGRGATIGAGAVILSGLRIGDHAMVGAGAIVTREVPRHALVVGNPARVRGWVCACGHRLADRGADCPDCGSRSDG